MFCSLPGFLKKSLNSCLKFCLWIVLAARGKKEIGVIYEAAQTKNSLLIMEKGVPVLIIIQCPAVCLLYEDEIIRGIASNDL